MERIVPWTGQFGGWSASISRVCRLEQELGLSERQWLKTLDMCQGWPRSHIRLLEWPSWPPDLHPIEHLSVATEVQCLWQEEYPDGHPSLVSSRWLDVWADLSHIFWHNTVQGCTNSTLQFGNIGRRFLASYASHCTPEGVIEQVEVRAARRPYSKTKGGFSARSVGSTWLCVPARHPIERSHLQGRSGAPTPRLFDAKAAGTLAQSLMCQNPHRLEEVEQVPGTRGSCWRCWMTRFSAPLSPWTSFDWLLWQLLCRDIGEMNLFVVFPACWCLRRFSRTLAWFRQPTRVRYTMVWRSGLM